MAVPPPVLFRRALARRCPRCDGARLFALYARLHERCPSCGHAFRRESGASTGSMYVSAAVTQGFAVLVMLVLWFVTDWSLGVELALGAALVAAFCYAFLPYSIALWVAVEYWTDLHNRESWAAPPVAGPRDLAPRPPASRTP